MKSIWRPVSEKPDLKVSDRIIVRSADFLGVVPHKFNAFTLANWERLARGWLGWCYYEDIEKAMLPDENTVEIEICERPKDGACIMAKTCYTDRFGREVYQFDRGVYHAITDSFFNDETGEEIDWKFIHFWVPYRGGEVPK